MTSTNSMKYIFTVFVLMTSSWYVSAYTVPVYSSSAAGAPAEQQATVGKCGSFGWDLEACNCFGATAACSTDPDHGCKPQAGIYNIAYVPAGRCRKHVPGDCPSDAIVKRKSDEWTSRTEWMNWNTASAVARYERLVARAAQAGYQAIEPDDTTEYVTPEILRMLTDIAQKYKMKMVVKNDIKGTWTAFVQQNPTYRKNIAMVLVEACTTYNECDKYIPFRNAGIPIVLTVRGFGKVVTPELARAARDLHAAAAVVETRENVRTVTTFGQICMDGSQIPAGHGPAQSQLQQLTRPSFVGFNPGGGAWSQSDFDRLQPAATPSYLNPNQALGAGTANPYAQNYWQPGGGTSGAGGAPLSSGGSVAPVGQTSSFVSTAQNAQQTAPTQAVITSVDPDRPLLADEEDEASDTEIVATEKSEKEKGAPVVPQGKLLCPASVQKNTLASLVWRCPEGTVGEVRSSDVLVGAKKRVGAARVRIQSRAVFTLTCSLVTNEDAQGSTRTCAVGVLSSTSTKTVPPATPPLSPDTNVDGSENTKPQACFLGFCL